MINCTGRLEVRFEGPASNAVDRVVSITQAIQNAQNSRSVILRHRTRIRSLSQALNSSLFSFLLFSYHVDHVYFRSSGTSHFKSVPWLRYLRSASPADINGEYRITFVCSWFVYVIINFLCHLSRAHFSLAAIPDCPNFPLVHT